MENLTTRLVGAAEATRLGIKQGWYGTRVSGTLMTGACATQAACLDAIAQLPDDIVVASAAVEELAVKHARTSHFSLGPTFVTARQIGYKPSRQGRWR